MKKSKEYKIIYSTTLESLQRRVNLAIKVNSSIEYKWEPIGGVSAVYHSSAKAVLFYQAMVR